MWILALLAIPIRGCVVDNERFREYRGRWFYCHRISLWHNAIGRPKDAPIKRLPEWCDRMGRLPKRYDKSTWVRFWE